MPETTEPKETPEPSQSVAEKANTKSPKKPGKKKTGSYDDTAEVEKILKTVISAQSQTEKESPSVTAEESKSPSASPSKTKKSNKGKPKTAASTAASSHTEQTPEGSLPTPPPITAGLADELDAAKQESATLKNALAQKNKLLSGGFVRLNLYLKQIRSQLDQLQTHLDKLSQQSLKEVRTPLADKTSWPKYSKPAEENTQWKQFVDEIEKLYKKVSPPINLKVEDWPARAAEEKTAHAKDWDKTLVHLRRSAQKKKELQEREESKFRESVEHIGENQVIDSFGAVRESLRRIQGLMQSPALGEQEPPAAEIPEPGEQKQAPSAQTGPETEISPTRGEKLSYRQFVRDLKHSDRVIRIKAAEVLAKSKLKSTPEVLMDAWCDETDPEARTAIIKALVELDYKEAISFFTDALDEDDLKIQMAALEGLYKFETDKKTTAGLLKALRSQYYHIRRRAVTYLGWSKASVALPQLLKLLKDENEFVRKATISTLFSFRNKESIPHLIEALHDSSLSVRKKAIEVLYRWTGLRNDFKPNASGSKRLEGIDRWREWWDKNGKTFRISQIYRVEEPPEAKKEKTAPVTPSPAKKKTTPKKVTKPSAPKRPSRKRITTAAEDEHLVLVSDIFPEPPDEPDLEKKTAPLPVNEKNLQNVISTSSGGITLMELGDKFGVKWQTLIPKTKKLVEAKKIKKVKNKYMRK
jgi:hypothetical protein